LLEPVERAEGAPAMTAGSCLDRGWQAVSALTGLERPAVWAPVPAAGTPSEDGVNPAEDAAATGDESS
jgi:hypothetical protein